MTADRHTKYINLDFVRGLAALVVLVNHARGFVMKAPADLESRPDVLGLGYYFLTGFGHQAVMVFFVLSGFFISRSILHLIAREQWTWRRYLISRMARLWAVLIPALLLTLLFDKLGLLWSPNTLFYDGSLFPIYGSGPGRDYR